MAYDIKRGDIYLADLSDASKYELSGMRPVLIISNDIINRRFPVVIGVPLTSRTDKINNSTHVRINPVNNGLELLSVAIVEQIRTIDKARLKNKIGSLQEDEAIEGINKALETCMLPDRIVYKMTPIQRKLVLNDIVVFDEDIEYEFKETKGYSLNSIKDTIDMYVCAFLNSKGGRILYGVNNNGVICGLNADRNLRDKIRTSINTEVHKIQPAIDPTIYDVIFHEVYDKKGSEDAIENLFVLEVLVKPLMDSKFLYFTGSSMAYVKVPGGKKQLNGMEIQEWIKNRMING